MEQPLFISYGEIFYVRIRKDCRTTAGERRIPALEDNNIKDLSHENCSNSYNERREGVKLI